MTALRKQIEREFMEKVKLEDNIMEKMRSQLTLDKASQYTRKVTDKLRRRATELVSYLLNIISPIEIQYRPRGLQHLHARTMRAIWRIYTPSTLALRARKILHVVLHAS